MKKGNQATLGAVYAAGAYLFWGGMPLYFALFSDIHAVDMLAWRVLFAFVTCAILLTALRQWRTLKPALTNRRSLLFLFLASIAISCNWGIYIYAVTSGYVLQASLGYFINPIATVVLGVIVLKEKLRRLQWAAVGVSVISVLILSIHYGTVPWISLALAISFAIYGLLKNQVGGRITALSGLSVETLWISIPSVIWIVLGQMSLLGDYSAGLDIFNELSPALIVGLSLAGLVTAVPLLMFAGSTSRLPLSTVGMFQYITPIVQFLLGYLVFKESMDTVQWVGFGFIWIAVIILIVDVLRARRQNPGAIEFPTETKQD